MAKLVEILARELKEWPDGVEMIVQDITRELLEASGISMFAGRAVWLNVARLSPEIHAEELAGDWMVAKSTRAQWEAERARIAANQ